MKWILIISMICHVCAIFVRQNIMSLSDDEWFEWTSQLQRLKDDGFYDELTALHGNPDFFKLVHRNEFFLPWHRWFLMQLESALGLPIPYWEWTNDSDREWNSTIWSRVGNLGACLQSGPWVEWKTINHGCIHRSGSHTTNISSWSTVLNVLQTNGSDFKKMLEDGPHASVHLFVGGNMASFASPDDPLFWFHHAFVDKIWMVRQLCYNGSDFDSFRDWRFPNRSDVTIGDMLSYSSLGYIYTDMFSMCV